VIEHVPPQDIHNISATKVREQMKKEGKLWSIHQYIDTYLKHFRTD
jgi:hypothetical protein